MDPTKAQYLTSLVDCLTRLTLYVKIKVVRDFRNISLVMAEEAIGMYGMLSRYHLRTQDPASALTEDNMIS